MGRLDGIVAVVTGAGGGIGEAVAALFAAEGAVVAAADRDSDAAEATARHSQGIEPFAVDVADEESVRRLFDDVTARWKTPTVVVANAGITRPALLHKMQTDDFDAVWNVNGRGVFFCLREAATRLIELGEGGSIVTVTSSAALLGTIGQINYSAAKGAVTSMTKSAARELARHRIRVNAVAPIAATPMTEKLRSDDRLSTRYLAQIPLRRFGTPREVAEAFLFLADPASSYVTGQVVCVDGGLVMVS
jgi:3-oxoacyl-[acyl-carrier protein] reductase